MELLLRTPHGSHLYGLSHDQSDEDWFEVYGFEKGKTKQVLEDNQDTVKTSLDSFLHNCDKGVPQFLEAMFSKQKEVNEIAYVTEHFHPNMTNVRDTYNRTIKSFWKRGVEEENPKFRRHAFRLKFNLEEMERTGRFNPTLSAWEAELLTSLAVDNTMGHLLGL